MKRILYIVAVIFFILIINELANSIYDLWSKKDLVTSAQKKLDEERLKNQRLKGELSYVKTSEFIEEEARNKLFLVKPNEKVVIVPTASKSASEKKQPSKPNWQKWVELFF